MSSLVELRNVMKKYGNIKAIDQFSCNIDKGKIVGLLGSNGSGKTTLLKMLAGLAHPNEGEIIIKGCPIGINTKRIVSYMPDIPLIEPWMKVEDAIAFYRDFYQDFDHSKANQMINFMKLHQKEPLQRLSKGMHERLQLTLALSRNASLYLLDEPIAGVDSVARENILDAILEFYNPESTVIITTHLISEIERLFDEVVLVKSGKLVMHKEVEWIRHEYGKSIDELFKEVYE